MDAQTIRQTYDLLTLASQHTQLKKAGRYHVGACPFCGGTDRFTLKPTNDGWRWHCRHCGDDKYRDAIDFVMRLDGSDFKTALRKLGGDVQINATRQQQPARKKIELPTEEWQAAGLRLITEYAHRLTADEDAQLAREYLMMRGLHYGTWDAWLLGYTVANGRPAITIPWMDTNGVDEALYAVKYRYVDEPAKNDKGQRYSMLKGSKQFLFGLQHILDIDDTLVLVEGEINAMSIWQCLPSRVSVVSMGSQSYSEPKVLQILARKYKRVVVWMDDGDEAAKTAKLLQHANARVFRSPMEQGVKYDANQCLQAGILEELLTKKLGTVCFGHMLDNPATA